MLPADCVLGVPVQVEVLEAVARDPRGGAAMELLLHPGGGGAGGGTAGEALLRAEVKALREHVDRCTPL